MAHFHCGQQRLGSGLQSKSRALGEALLTRSRAAIESLVSPSHRVSGVWRLQHTQG
jgi:hypothetical protein